MTTKTKKTTKKTAKTATAEHPHVNTDVRERDRAIVRMLVRAREDFQDMRKRMDNRLARKADGSSQDVDDGRTIQGEDAAMFTGIADAARVQEAAVEKQLKAVCKRFAVNAWLEEVKGVGTIAKGWIMGEIDIHRATTVSKIWQFVGLNPGMVQGKKRVENKDGSFGYIVTDSLVRGDKLTAGFVAPFNKRLRTALVGVMGDGFIKAQNRYAMEFYYPMKARLEQSDNTVPEIRKAGAKAVDVPWNEAKKAHRHRAAIRYMVKMFLKDLYVAWRTAEGLELRVPYAEEYLGRKHHG